MNQLLATYTFEPMTTKTTFDEHRLNVQDDDRIIPFGQFKIRLKNINDQHYYELNLKQQLTRITNHGFQLKDRLHGIKVRHVKQPTNKLVIATTLKIKQVPASMPAPKQHQLRTTCDVPVMNHQATTLPMQVPVYAFHDNHQIVLNQTALAKLFLTTDLGQTA
ncbi:hypothetical protein [Lactiplantibacillus daowaiensis]|uniref:Uncharacterized protein n=1 Tax=Lactiplantibacillus daowaiensis TaxID=2559918 RepID=A0ABW1RX70_9LACO|nr:hypothetical protein [Lactiplantibacillus daowaiensis]